MRQLELTAPASLGEHAASSIHSPAACNGAYGRNPSCGRQRKECPALTWVLEKAKAFGLPPT